MKRGRTDGDFEWLLDYRLPYDPSGRDPFVFHVLTSLPVRRGEAAVQQMIGLVEDDMEILPAEEARAAGHRALMFPSDEAAGDGCCIFMTPLRPFHYSQSVPADFSGHLAVAYRLSTLERLAPECLQFRVHDLGSGYTDVMATVSEGALLGDDPDLDVSSFLDAQLSYELEEQKAEIVSEELGIIREVGTVEDQGDGAPAKLLRIYAQCMAGKITKEKAMRLAEPLLPREVQDPEVAAELEDRYLLPPLHEIIRAWDDLFYYDTPLHRPAPELLVSCAIPLSAADAVRVDRHWHLM